MPPKKKPWEVDDVKKDRGTIDQIHIKDRDWEEKETVVHEIETGRDVSIENGPSLHVVDGPDGKYVRSNPDGETDNNLGEQ